MKWKFTIFMNVCIVFGFWLAGLIALSPAFNYFVEYTETNDQISLPMLTSMVFTVRLDSLLVPLFWLLVSMIFVVKLKQKVPIERIETVQLHTSVSILVGLLLFVVFALAGILPFLKFGGLFE